MQYVEVKDIFYGALNVLNPRIAELYHFVTFRADQMVMLSAAVSLLVLCEIFPELVFAYQIALNQEIKCVINRRPANPVVFIFHADVQRLNIKVAIARINFFEDRIAFRRFPQLLVLQVSRENLFYFLVCL